LLYDAVSQTEQIPRFWKVHQRRGNLGAGMADVVCTKASGYPVAEGRSNPTPKQGQQPKTPQIKLILRMELYKNRFHVMVFSRCVLLLKKKPPQGCAFEIRLCVSAPQFASQGQIYSSGKKTRIERIFSQ